jgi:hypothetical protein
MFKIWCENNQVTHFDITYQNPKQSLSVQLNVADLIEMEKNKIITTNEFRRYIGFEDFSNEQLQERESARKLALQIKNTQSKI